MSTALRAVVSMVLMVGVMMMVVMMTVTITIVDDGDSGVGSDGDVRYNVRG